MPNKSQPNLSRNRLVLLLVAGLFAAPVLLATMMHTQWWDFRPTTTKNNGELIQPPSEIQNWPTRLTQEQTHIWTLAAYFPEGCDDSCLKYLDDLRRVRAAQGRHREQLEVILLTNEMSAQKQHSALETLGEFIIPEPENTQPSTTLALKNLQAQHSESFIIDPYGFIMMRYAIQHDPNGIRQDLAKLLRLDNKTLGLVPRLDDELIEQ